MVKILVLHPSDDPLHAALPQHAWDRVIDLGTAGWDSHQRWSGVFRCPVMSAGKLQGADFAQIRAVLSSGSGILVDERGIDWWDLIALEFHQQLEEITRLRRVVRELNLTNGDVFVTRSCLQATVLELLLEREVNCLSNRDRPLDKLRHYTHVFSKFSLSQLLQILGDKYDTGYQVRRLFCSRPQKASRPVVLLPSAYINVTRTELQYAEMLADSEFVLIATRPSGWTSRVPKNVRIEKLASYAAGDKSRAEFQRLAAQWDEMKRDLMRNELLSVLIRSGALRSFPRFLREGLMIRDAWVEVFKNEPVRAVLCADDANLPSRIPLLLAQQRGITAIACHHGALDGRHRLRPRRDSLFLAKGRMEQDYLQQVCGVPSNEIEVGAPSKPVSPLPRNTPAPFIVFFSDQYEVLSGRAKEFYRDVLPALADLAAANNRGVVLKLHPAENLRERKRMVESVLSRRQFEIVSFIAGPLTDDLLAQTWFAVTVLSTTAVDCALRGVPAFSCAWLEYSNYGYAEQLVKFRAAMRLSAPSEIATIPERLKSFLQSDSSELWQTITRDRFDELLSGRAISKMAVAG